MTSSQTITRGTTYKPKRQAAELLAEDSVLFSQIVDQVLLVAVQPSGQGEDEELQSMRHRPRLRRSDTAETGPCLNDLAASAGFLPLYGVVANCLEKEPQRRYQSALDIRNELEGLRDEVIG